MKRFKKLASLLLAVVMVLAMSVQGFAASGTAAAGDNGVIEIDNAIIGKTYKIYKLFTLESYNYTSQSEEGNYAYTIDSTSDWYNFVTTGEGQNYVELYDITSADGVIKAYIKWKSGADAASFAKDALAYANENSVDADRSTEAGNNKVSFSGLALGYYLVDSSVGALCSLNSTNLVAEIEEKNEVPTVEKSADVETATIGDVVHFTVTITKQAGAQNYVLHDEMADGLTFKADTVVAEVGSTVLAKDDVYSVVTANLDDDCTFEIVFNNVAGIEDGSEIVVMYDAILNENAVIAGDGNINDAALTYGDGHRTATDSCAVKTYAFDLVKTATVSQVDKLLSGAEFDLYDGNGENANRIHVVKVTENGEVYYRVDEKGASTDKIEAGHVTIKGLGSGIYWLEETKAPDGYNKLTSRQKVEIGDSNNTATVLDDVYISGGVQVINNTGTLLPSTGGIGTTVFYAAGIVLMAGAVFFVVRKKRG